MVWSFTVLYFDGFFLVLNGKLDGSQIKVESDAEGFDDRFLETPQPVEAPQLVFRGCVG